MNEIINHSLVNWSRGQFALTVMFHFIFVPLTLGLSIMVAMMETRYYQTKDEVWKKISHFWMTLFGINFAIGVATGIIMEFQFGTNWANYSWIVGDIFGAPLAIEGLAAFFLEATFFAVIFFGREKVSRRFYLTSAWMVAIGSNLSALWILVANGWMQYPVGTTFNLDLARFEMTDFMEVVLSPVAISKFIHTVSSGLVTAALFVLGISSYYLLKKRHILFAKKSALFAAAFGLISTLGVISTGDHAAHYVAQTQPMKLAAMEGMFHGEEGAGLTVFGIFNHKKELKDDQPNYYLEVKIPYLLSYLGYRDLHAFVPGIEDLVYGNTQYKVMSVKEKMVSGKKAVSSVQDYNRARKAGDENAMLRAKAAFEENGQYLGYGYLETPEEAVPPLALTVHSFHLMVALGSFFVVLFLAFLILGKMNKLDHFKIPLYAGLFSLPLGFLSCQLGWIVAEVGRQPWAIQDILPVKIAATDIATSHVQLTFWLFFVLFTILFSAELKIMLSQIKKGPESLDGKGGHHAV